MVGGSAQSVPKGGEKSGDAGKARGGGGIFRRKPGLGDWRRKRSAGAHKKMGGDEYYGQ